MKSYLVGISKHLCMKRVKPALKEKYVWLFLLSASCVVVVVVSKMKMENFRVNVFFVVVSARKN